MSPASEYDTISYEVTEGIATLTLDRPDALNAITTQMIDEMVAALDRVDADDDVRAVIFTGRGRAFCAGADLSEGAEIFRRGDDGFRMDRDADGGGVFSRRAFACTKPMIAAINGPAVGMGVTMTLPMDVRICAEGARFGFVFTRRGLVPEACSSWFLPRIVGISRAAEWIYSGRLFDAAEAERAGLVRSVHPSGDLLETARALAVSMTEHSAPVAVAISRKMLWTMLAEGDPEIAHEIDSRGIASLGTSPDAQEGVQAFLERRDPIFPMRPSTDMPDWYRRWVEVGSARELIAEAP